MNIHYGAIFQSIGGIAGAIATGIAAWWAKRASDAAKAATSTAEVSTASAVRLAEIEDRREADRADRERRAQAELVSAWWTRAPIPPFNSAMWRAWVRNASEQPVYDIRVRFYFRFGDEWPWRGDGVNQPAVAPPGEAITVEAGPDMLRQLEGGDAYNYAVAVEFTDAAGIRWRRDERGRLAEQN